MRQPLSSVLTPSISTCYHAGHCMACHTLVLLTAVLPAHQLAVRSIPSLKASLSICSPPPSLTPLPTQPHTQTNRRLCVGLSWKGPRAGGQCPLWGLFDPKCAHQNSQTLPPIRQGQNTPQELCLPRHPPFLPFFPTTTTHSRSACNQLCTACQLASICLWCV